MTRWVGAIVGATLTLVATVSGTACADTVQLTVRDGRLSLVAINATPAEIFDAWSRAGGVHIVNAERIPGAPLTITLENVPEEQALDTLLRPVTGYLALRRTAPAPSASVFDRIVIVPTPAASRPAATPAPPAGPVFGPHPASAPPPPIFPQAPQQPQGVERIIGADGQPVEDDQAGAPPPPITSATGDAPDARTLVPQRGAPQPPQNPQPPQYNGQPVEPGAPAGVPRPGMVVPSPPGQQPGQQLPVR